MLSLDWVYVARPSAVHAAAGIDAGLIPIDTDLTAAIGRPLVEVVDRLRAFDVDRAEFWRQLVRAFVSNDPTGQIVATALKRCLGPIEDRPTAHAEVAEAVSNIISQSADHLLAASELELRCQPLRSQWQTYGPGLMKSIALHSDPSLIVEQANLIAVQPVFGGAGCAHLYANTAHIEALMVNTDAALPEVIRLAWLVAQMNNDLPMHSETVNRRRLPMVSGLAILPATLLAAADLGLANYSRDMLSRAIGTWHVFGGDRALAAEIVEMWWETAVGGSFAWGTALQALDRMMQPIACAS